MPKQLVTQSLKQKLKLLNKINLEIFTTGFRAMKFGINKRNQRVYHYVLNGRGKWYKNRLSNYVGQESFSLHNTFTLQLWMGGRRYRVLINPISNTCTIFYEYVNSDNVVAYHIPLEYELTKFSLHRTKVESLW